MIWIVVFVLGISAPCVDSTNTLLAHQQPAPAPSAMCIPVCSMGSLWCRDAAGPSSPGLLPLRCFPDPSLDLLRFSPRRRGEELGQDAGGEESQLHQIWVERGRAGRFKRNGMATRSGEAAPFGRSRNGRVGGE